MCRLVAIPVSHGRSSNCTGLPIWMIKHPKKAIDCLGAMWVQGLQDPCEERKNPSVVCHIRNQKGFHFLPQKGGWEVSKGCSCCKPSEHGLLWLNVGSKVLGLQGGHINLADLEKLLFLFSTFFKVIFLTCLLWGQLAYSLVIEEWHLQCLHL